MSSEAEAQNQGKQAEDPSAEEASWVTAVLDGDAKAYDRLVRRYQRRAVAVAYRLLGNSHDAADAAQDAFLRAYRNLKSLEDPRRFGPWLMRIVTNLSLNLRRARGTGVARSAAALDDTMEMPDGFRRPTGEVPVGEVAPTDASISGELRDAIGRAVDALPEKQRLSLVLYSIEGIPQKDVAEILECSVELVKWNVFQARKALRKDLERFLKP